MIDTFARLRTVLLLMTVCTTVSAQNCRDDIPSSAPDSRFTVLGGGTVSDAATRLTWKQCAEGLSGVGCTAGSASFTTWQGALQAAADADFADHTDWRLPSKNELESLIEWRCTSPAINATYFPNTPSDWFWSASPYTRYPEHAWSVRFSFGDVDGSTKDSDAYVRLVRGG